MPLLGTPIGLSAFGGLLVAEGILLVLPLILALDRKFELFSNCSLIFTGGSATGGLLLFERFVSRAGSCRACAAFAAALALGFEAGRAADGEERGAASVDTAGRAVGRFGNFTGAGAGFDDSASSSHTRRHVITLERPSSAHRVHLMCLGAYLAALAGIRVTHCPRRTKPSGSTTSWSAPTLAS